MRTGKTGRSDIGSGRRFRGEVVSREGNNAQIRLLAGCPGGCQWDADIRLELGQNITFQVKNK